MTPPIVQDLPPPPWPALRPRFERVVFRFGVTEVARCIYGSSGAGCEQAGRRSIYKWLEGVEPQAISRRQLWLCVQRFEALPAPNVPAGADAAPSKARRPR